MIFNKFNILSFLILLVINSFLIYRSHRGKRFAYYSTKVFILIFASYWVTMLVFFQTFDFANLSASNSKTKKMVPKYETTYTIKTRYENDTKYKIQTLNRIMTAAAIQAILVVVLSIAGIVWLNDRVEYYIRVILIFVLVLIFCFWILHLGSITGYEEIAP